MPATRLNRPYLCAFLVLFSLSQTSCQVDDPKTELVNISKTLADKSINKSSGVGRGAQTVKLSDRQFTYLDIPEALRDKPYYIDFDIFRDKGKIWTEADIICQGCDPEVKKARAQNWDIRIDNKHISLNTNRVDDKGKTLQSMAATNYLEPILGFEQSIDLDNIQFRQQLPNVESKIDPKSLFDNTTGRVGTNNAWLIRTSSGKRIVYLQFIDYDIQGQWLLFHVREQPLGQANAQFQPPKKIYIKWSSEAVGQGKIQLSPSGELFAYFDFDGCFPDVGQGPCFAGVSSQLGNDVVSTMPMNGWDFYYNTNISNMTGGITKLNGGLGRDRFNEGVDVAALNLGKVPSQLIHSFTLSMRQLWGFSSFGEFQTQAINSKRYKQTALGTDGKNDFAGALWYDIKHRAGHNKLVPNNRIYIVETTKSEGLGLQIAEIDEQGRISRIEYKGLLVKERRKFDIHFRRHNQSNIYDLRNIKVPKNPDTSYFPIISLQDEIVDDDGKPLSDDEFAQLRFSVATLCHSGGHNVELRQSAISSASANMLSETGFAVNAHTLSYSVGTENGIPSPIVLSISARQLGKKPVTWQTGLCFYSPDSDAVHGYRKIPCDNADPMWENQLKCN